MVLHKCHWYRMCHTGKVGPQAFQEEARNQPMVKTTHLSVPCPLAQCADTLGQQLCMVLHKCHWYRMCHTGKVGPQAFLEEARNQPMVKTTHLSVPCPLAQCADTLGQQLCMVLHKCHWYRMCHTGKVGPQAFQEEARNQPMVKTTHLSVP